MVLFNRSLLAREKFIEKNEIRMLKKNTLDFVKMVRYYKKKIRENLCRYTEK